MTSPSDSADAVVKSREEMRRELMALPFDPPREWRVDPTDAALQSSTWRHELPEALCLDIGRRLLRAHLEFSEWVLRRVERVHFERDRSIARDIGIDLNVRPDAPIFIDRNDDRYWLLPLSVMRRRTLINLRVRDEADVPLTLPGMRLSQQLDQALMLAAAAAVPIDAALREKTWPELREFVRDFIAGPWETVRARALEWESASPPAWLRPYAADALFAATYYRLLRSFTLYVFLRQESGRHRALHMSFEEPISWRYREPTLDKQDGAIMYSPISPVGRRDPRPLLAALGLRPARIRLQTPGAELASSYHFEAAAPQGVRIVSASLVAGRPHEPGRVAAVDNMVGSQPTIGLHAVEVPTGSLCRVQLDLGIPTWGWLTTVVVSSVVIAAVLVSVAYHWLRGSPDWDTGQSTNVVLILVTTSAGVATLVAQRDFSEVAARLVSFPRRLATAAMILPALAAGFVTYGALLEDASHRHVRQAAIERWCILGIAVASCLIAALLALAWVRARKGERRPVVPSPWDMTVDDTDPDRRGDHDDSADTFDFDAACTRYEFNSPAVGGASAEAWHERYSWTDREQHRAILAVAPRPAPSIPGQRRASSPSCGAANDVCRGPDTCQFLMAPDAVTLPEAQQEIHPTR